MASCRAGRQFASDFAAVGLAILFSLSLSACSSPTQNYLRNGIGSELPARDIRSATTLQQEYFEYLCEQVGLGVAPGCILPLVDEAVWTLIVYQGMNDIDRRCDAYLAWLDDKKRSKEPLLSQISAVRTTTEGIIGITDPNSARAISIVGLAFQLLTDSVENYHSRLLLEIESSTINSVVLRARHDFRQALEGKVFANRPDAEYALREYLRRCLPFAIESQINDLSTLGSRGIRASEENTIFQDPVAGARPFEPADRIVRARRPRTAPEGAGSPAEKRAGLRISAAIQEALCLTPDGALGAQTRAGIDIFEQTVHSRPQDRSRINGTLDDEEISDLLAVGPCRGEFKNYFERTRISDADTITAISAHLAEHVANVPTTSSLSELRTFIRTRRQMLQMDNGPGNMFEDQITLNFLRKSGFSLR